LCTSSCLVSFAGQITCIMQVLHIIIYTALCRLLDIMLVHIQRFTAGGGRLCLVLTAAALIDVWCS